jgi:hypothetical protein
MNRGPTTNQQFLATLQKWFQTQSEVMVLIRIRCGAGSKDFEFYSACETLIKRMQGLSHGTCITVFKQPQLLIRGIVDDEFMARCLDEIPDGVEYLMVEIKQLWQAKGRGSTMAQEYHMGNCETTFGNRSAFMLQLDCIHLRWTKRMK